MGLTGQIESLAVSSDGKSVAALAQNWEVGVWDLESGHLKFTVDVPPGEFVDNAGLVLSPDGRTLAYSVGTLREGVALLFDGSTGAELRRWRLPAGLENRFAFESADRLWHFQLELGNREGLPTSDWVPWQKYPRVGRIRNLLGKEPEKSVAEIHDYPRGIFRARMTPDGKYTLLEGNSAGRSVKVVENATGRIASSHASGNPAKSSDLIIDGGGKSAWFSDDPNRGTARIPIPASPAEYGVEFTPCASNAMSGHTCGYLYGQAIGCFLFHSTSGPPLANFAPGIRVNACAFDPLGRRLIWGGRDGGVVACDLATVNARLKPLGLNWRGD